MEMENLGFDFDFVMIGITLDQAIDEGLLVPIFVNRWPQLSGGKPIIATRAVLSEFSLAAMREVWNEYVIWRRTIMPTLPEEEQMFSTTMNYQALWLIEDASAFTILFPEDY
jgi:hypothetical protein